MEIQPIYDRFMSRVHFDDKDPIVREHINATYLEGIPASDMPSVEAVFLREGNKNGCCLNLSLALIYEMKKTDFFSEIKLITNIDGETPDGRPTSHVAVLFRYIDDTTKYVIDPGADLKDNTLRYETPIRRYIADKFPLKIYNIFGSVRNVPFFEVLSLYPEKTLHSFQDLNKI